MTRRIAGCDLGKASARFVIARVDDEGTLEIEHEHHLHHEGRPFEHFEAWYRDRQIDRCDALGATGVYAEKLREPVLVLPEDACQQAALEREVPGGPVTLVNVGARGYSTLARDGDGQVRYLENDKCSSGTGENAIKIAGRFGLTIEQADELAGAAERGVPITARCSVFTKSEMTHHANQGEPAAALFRGYFDSMVGNTRALLERNRADGPVLLIGGCGELASFRRAFADGLGAELRRPDHAPVFEALGAALMACEQAAATPPSPLPGDPTELVDRSGRQFRVLQPADGWADKVEILDLPAPPDWRGRPAVLGLDLGSTGAKAVLVDLETGDPLLDVYDRTRGNPVEASRRLVGAILDGGSPDVRAIGVTGSGRVAVATLLQGVFPESGRVVTVNEIAAHATAAVRVDAGDGEDLSVIEIGGQDAKYIRVQGGRVVESDLNQACSAGTGSFLEEQAAASEVTDIADVVRMANGATRPPDLGQMCTVYMADAAAEALKEDFDLGDIFAGLQYSIVHNYLNRVMGQRTLAPRIFFQGKPASNPSLAWTLAAVTGREITVPPNPGAMGAWGIGLSAIESLGADDLTADAPMDLAAVLRAEITERSSFTCRDKRCATSCPIDRTVVAVEGEERIALSGGACAKYEVIGGAANKLPTGAPDPFVDRAERLLGFGHEAPDAPEIAIPLTGAVGPHVPWLATFARELGYGVRILASDRDSLARGEQLCNSFDSCGPTKIAHAICDTDAPLLLFPAILDAGDREGFSGQTCVTQQAMPEIVEQSLRTRGRDVRVVRPVLSFDRDPVDADRERGQRLADALAEAGDAPVGDHYRIGRAARRAARAQREFDEAMARVGHKSAEYARQHGLPVVLVCGHRHVIHDRAINADIPHLLRQNGAMAIPMDAFPVDPDTPGMEKVYWGDANRSVRAAHSARARGEAFPLMLSSFGCGPASFTEHVFQALLEGHPHTILESDGHGGAAGYVTRIQAFMHSVEQFRGEDAPPTAGDGSKGAAIVGPTPRTGPYMDRGVRYVFLSGPDFLGDLFAAVYRAHGYDAHAAPPMTHENLALGRQNCSGKECISYQLIWGAFREYLESNPTDRPIRLMQISGQMCRGGMFPTKDKLAVAQLGMEDQVSVVPIRIAGGTGMSTSTWVGLTALDIVRQLYMYTAPCETEPGDAEALYRDHSERIVELFERPARHGLLTAVHLAGQWRAVGRLLDDAALAFADLEQRGGGDGDLPTVFVSGDALTKGNDFANAGVFRHLATRGIRAVPEPIGDFLEFLAIDHPHLFFGRNASKTTRAAFLPSMTLIRNRLYGRVRRHHPWLPVPRVRAALERAQPILDRATNGGSVLAVGSVLHHMEQNPFDGVVMTSCWGCDNGLIEESLLRHQREFPTLFFYDDAMPLDVRKVDSFAFGLRRLPARSAPEP